MDDIRHERLNRLRLSKPEWFLISECLTEAATMSKMAMEIVERIDAGTLEALPGVAMELLRKQATKAVELRSLALKVGMRMTNQHDADF